MSYNICHPREAKRNPGVHCRAIRPSRGKGLLVLTGALALLAACSPLSVGMNAVSIGLGMKAGEENQKREEARHFQQKCYWKKYDAYEQALKAERGGDLVAAYEYYRIGELLEHGPSRAQRVLLAPRLTAEQLREAEGRVTRHSRENIETCYYARVK